MILPALLCAAVAASPPPVKLAAPGLSYVDIPAERREFYNQHLAQQLISAGVRVVTQREIQTLLGMERQKQLAGCAEDAQSCLAELADALGADGAVVGDVARVGDKYQVNLKIISGRDGNALAVHSARVEGDEDLLDELTRGAKSMSRQVLKVLRPGLTPAPEVAAETGGGGLRSAALYPAIGGGVFLVGGGVALLLANGKASDLSTRSGLSDAEAVSLRDSGKTLQTVGGVGVAVGVSALAAAAGMYLFGGDDAEAQALSVGTDGHSLVFGGRF